MRRPAPPVLLAMLCILSGAAVAAAPDFVAGGNGAGDGRLVLGYRSVVPAGEYAEDAPRTVDAYRRDRAGSARRSTRRVLRMLGLSRRRNLDLVVTENAWLRHELQRMRQMAAEAEAAVTRLNRQLERTEVANNALRDELRRTRQAFAEAEAAIVRLNRRADQAHIAAEIDRQKLLTMDLLRQQLDRAKSEIAFRTARWHRAVADGKEAAALAGYGFSPLRLTRSVPVRPGPYHIKSYAERLAVSGLEAHRACWLELSCLTRLQALAGPAVSRFPVPVSLDADAPTLTMTHLGWALNDVPADLQSGIATLVCQDLAEQVDEIVSGLAKAGVVHLDLQRSGCNLVVNGQGKVGLIDFDIAVIGGKPISAVISERLKEWQNNGAYDRTTDVLTEQLSRFCDESLRA